MLVASIVLMCVGLLSMIVFIYGKLTNYSLKTTIIKAITSLLFVVLAIVLFACTGHKMGIFIICSTSLGLLGDVLLALKRVFESKKKLFTLTGLISFGVGHIVLSIGLFTNYYVNGNVLAIIIPLLTAAIYATLFVTFEKQLKIDFGKFKPVAFVYIFLVSLIPSIGMSLCILHNFSNTFLILIMVAGLFFLSSDSILSRSYFGNSSTKAELVIYTVTYYIAQFMIAFAIYFI